MNCFNPDNASIAADHGTLRAYTVPRITTDKEILELTIISS